jgi:hypothetical protein
MKLPMVLAVILMLGSVVSRAGGATNVTITRIEAEPQGHFFFYLSSAIQGSPSCASQPATGFVVDGTTAGGKVVITLVVTAYTMGKTLSMGGNNLCDVHAGFETISDIFTTN